MFDPKRTDVDEHVDLITTLGDMVDQKEEAKKEKFIETMPTMIQTHLITCKDWADVKDKAKSLKHIIQKCDPPTQQCPWSQQVQQYWDYIRISHIRWTKKKGKYPTI